MTDGFNTVESKSGTFTQRFFGSTSRVPDEDLAIALTDAMQERNLQVMYWTDVHNEGMPFAAATGELRALAHQAGLSDRDFVAHCDRLKLSNVGRTYIRNKEGHSSYKRYLVWFFESGMEPDTELVYVAQQLCKNLGKNRAKMLNSDSGGGRLLRALVRYYGSEEEFWRYMDISDELGQRLYSDIQSRDKQVENIDEIWCSGDRDWLYDIVKQEDVSIKDTIHYATRGTRDDIGDITLNKGTYGSVEFVWAYDGVQTPSDELLALAARAQDSTKCSFERNLLSNNGLGKLLRKLMAQYGTVDLCKWKLSQYGADASIVTAMLTYMKAHNCTVMSRRLFNDDTSLSAQTLDEELATLGFNRRNIVWKLEKIASNKVGFAQGSIWCMPDAKVSDELMGFLCRRWHVLVIGEVSYVDVSGADRRLFDILIRMYGSVEQVLNALRKAQISRIRDLESFMHDNAMDICVMNQAWTPQVFNDAMRWLGVSAQSLWLLFELGDKTLPHIGWLCHDEDVRVWCYDGTSEPSIPLLMYAEEMDEAIENEDEFSIHDSWEALDALLETYDTQEMLDDFMPKSLDDFVTTFMREHGYICVPWQKFMQESGFKQFCEECGSSIGAMRKRMYANRSRTWGVAYEHGPRFVWCMSDDLYETTDLFTYISCIVKDSSMTMDERFAMDDSLSVLANILIERMGKEKFYDSLREFSLCARVAQFLRECMEELDCQVASVRDLAKAHGRFSAMAPLRKNSKINILLKTFGAHRDVNTVLTLLEEANSETIGYVEFGNDSFVWCYDGNTRPSFDFIAQIKCLSMDLGLSFDELCAQEGSIGRMMAAFSGYSEGVNDIFRKYTVDES